MTTGKRQFHATVTATIQIVCEVDAAEAATFEEAEGMARACITEATRAAGELLETRERLTVAAIASKVETVSGNYTPGSES